MHDVLVVGGGIAGLTASRAIGDGGYTPPLPRSVTRWVEEHKVPERFQHARRTSKVTSDRR